MTDITSKIENSGISIDETSIGKKVSYSYNRKTKRHTIKTESGTVISYKTQAKSNKASIYLIKSDNGELVCLENINGATVTSSQSVWTQISIAGCNGCNVDVSQNNKKDLVTVWDSEKFKSKNNKVKIASNDELEIVATDNNVANISSKGKYSENTVKSEMNSWWRKFFGYSKE